MSGMPAAGLWQVSYPVPTLAQLYEQVPEWGGGTSHSTSPLVSIFCFKQLQWGLPG